MPEFPPLTPQLLQEFADTQGAVDTGLGQDCAAIEDILVRLAGPTLQGIEDDTAALAELQERLAAPALEGIKRDMQRITKMMRKLFTPTDTGINEDTTLLTGIAARAQGGTFRTQRGRPSHSRTHPGTGQVGAQGASVAQRPARPPYSAAGMAMPGPAPVGAAGGTAGQAAYPSNYLADGQSALAPIQPPLTSGPPASGGMGSTSAIPSFPPTGEVTPEGELAAEGLAGAFLPYGQDVLTPTPTYPPAPVGPIQPAPISTGPTNGGTVLGSPIPSLPPLAPTPPPPAPPLPLPVPPLPAPPPPECNLCDAILYLGQILHDGLSAIANSLALLTPGAQAQHQANLAAFGSALANYSLRWTSPPGQRETDRDIMGEYSHTDEVQAERALDTIGGGIAGGLVR